MKKYILSIMKDERKTPDAYIVRIFLSIVSVIYLALLRCTYLFRRAKILPSYEVPVKVISIGNITLGGTGKTPFTIKLARDIKAMGGKPAVLSRGYGNDESHMLEDKLEGIPVLTGRDRVKNAKKAFGELGSNCVILDDGFQHYRVKRDLDIVLIDMTSPFGNMKLFPRGILREPLGRLKEAGIAVLTKSDMGRDEVNSVRGLLRGLNEKIEIIESFYRPLDLMKISTKETMPLSCIVDKKIAALAGIANPDYFEWMIKNLGAGIEERFYYPDHYQYKSSDMTHIAKRCSAKDIRLVITTEKDAVRLKRLENMPPEIEILILRIDCRINSNEEALVNRLNSILRR